MDIEKKAAVVDAIIDEYLKPTPDEKDLKRLFRELDIKYADDGIANMKAVLNSIDFIEPNQKEDSHN